MLLEDAIKAFSNDESPATKRHRFVFLRNTYREGWGNKFLCKDDAQRVGCLPSVADLQEKCTDHSALLPLVADACTAGEKSSET